MCRVLHFNRYTRVRAHTCDGENGKPCTTLHGAPRQGRLRRWDRRAPSSAIAAHTMPGMAE